MTVLAAIATCAHFAVSPVQAMIEAHPEPQCLDEIAAPDWHKLPVALWEPCHGWLVIVNHMEPHLTETAYCAPRRPDPIALWAALEQTGGIWATGSSVAAIIVNPGRPVGGVLPIWGTCGCGHAHEPKDSTPPASPVPLPAGAWMLLSGLAALAMVRRRSWPASSRPTGAEKEKKMTSDLRDDEPAERTLDFDRDTKGNDRFSAEIEVWPYSSLRNEKVYSRIVLLLFKADDMRDAHGFAQCISTTISHAHDVWQTNLRKVWRR